MAILVLNGDGTSGMAAKNIDLDHEPCPSIMATGIGGMSFRGWQYWIENGGRGPARIVMGSAMPETDPEAFGMIQ